MPRAPPEEAEERGPAPPVLVGSTLTEARLQQQHHAIGNPDQAWVLGELIAYLESGRAGTGGFDDMGDRWVAVRDGARAKTLRATDAGVTEIAARWEQLIEFLGPLPDARI